MSKFMIYHNPRCSKSRQALEILQENNCEIEIVEYLKHPLSRHDFENLYAKLSTSDREKILRTKEADYKQLLSEGTKLKTASDLYSAIKKFPKILERPIVATDKLAVIGRPPENIKSLF